MYFGDIVDLCLAQAPFKMQYCSKEFVAQQLASLWAMLGVAWLRTSDSQSFSSPGTHKLITEFCSTPKTVFSAHLTKKKKKNRYNLIHSHQTAIVLAVVMFLFDNLRGKKRSVPLTKWSGIGCFNNSWGTLVENTALDQIMERPVRIRRL